jgi:steroid delta-isomerase-like uncharacterized protein
MGTTQENKAIMRRMIEEVWNQQKLDVADELFAATATAPDLPQLPPGPMGTKIVAQMFLTAFPDLHMTIEDLIAEEDKVVARFTETATHKGEFMGVPASGKSIKFTEMAIVRIANGQIVESWYNVDMLSIMQQIGAVPGPGG